MYTLIKGAIRYLLRRDEYFILILGLDNAGKSTFLECAKAKFDPLYKMINPEKITSTVGLNIGKIDSASTRLNFWDLGGQDELQTLWDKYYSECHSVIYVIDSTDQSRIEESVRAFSKMLDSHMLDGVPLLVVCNKCDKSDALSIAQIKDAFATSIEKIGKRDCHVIRTSALDGTNIHDSIDWIRQHVEKNSYQRPPKEYN